MLYFDSNVHLLRQLQYVPVSLDKYKCHNLTFFQQCQKESGSKLSLKDLIVRPIQRIPRYELLIQVGCSFE